MEQDKKIIIKVRAIILHEGKMLVVRHPCDLSFAALPGGHLEWGEDLRECLSREMVEELGVIPKIGRLLYVNTFIEKNIKQYVEFFFEVKNGVDYLNSEKLTRSHASELAEIIWLSPTDNIKILPNGLMIDFKKGGIISNETRYIKD